MYYFCKTCNGSGIQEKGWRVLLPWTKTTPCVECGGDGKQKPPGRRQRQYCDEGMHLIKHGECQRCGKPSEPTISELRGLRFRLKNLGAATWKHTELHEIGKLALTVIDAAKEAMSCVKCRGSGTEWLPIAGEEVECRQCETARRIIGEAFHG